MTAGYDLPPSHLRACVGVASWFLKQRWCNLAVTEIAGRTTAKLPPIPSERLPDRPVAPTVRRNATRAERQACHEEWEKHQAAMKKWRRECDRARTAWKHEHPEIGGGQLDVLAIQTPAFDKPYEVAPRVGVAEVKVQPSDLRQDLKKGKLYRYESQASHVYLAGTAEAFGVDNATAYHGSKNAEIIAGLAELGLPKFWGVILVRHWHHVRQDRNPWNESEIPVYVDPVLIRRPGIGPRAMEPTVMRRRALTEQMALSMCWRGFR